MYAVITTGGKQYRVQPGDLIQVEKLAGEEGSQVKFDRVLLLSSATTTENESSKIWLGKPYVDNAVVEGQIFRQGRAGKILVFKMKRRKKIRKLKGHRQNYTQILITSVDAGAGNNHVLSAQETKERLSKLTSNLRPRGGVKAKKV